MVHKTGRRDMHLGRLKLSIIILLTVSLTLPAWGQEKVWERKWNETIAAAKKEGKVVVVGPSEPETRRRIPAAFRARFGIPVEYLSGRTSQIAARIRAERRARLYSVDVFLATTNPMYLILYPEGALAPLKPALFLPDVINPSKWKTGKLWFMDPEEKYILRLFNNISSLLAINTDLVKRKELRSAKDFLNPKWRGRMTVDDPTARRGGGLVQAGRFYMLFGQEYVKKFYLDQKPVISRNRRQMTDWLARGTYPISFGADNEDVDRLRREGFPILNLVSLADVPASASSGGGGLLALANQAPHPNAARVFVNWMASKEGLEVYSRTNEVATTRNDIDEKSYLPAEKIPRPGVNYFDNSNYKFVTTTRERVRKYVKKILKR